MDDDSSHGRSSPSRLTFVLGLLVAVVICVIAVLALWGSFRSYTVTAYLKVNYSGSASTRVSPQEIEKQAMDALAMATSRGTLKAALARPGVGQLRNIRGNNNAEAWLRNRLQLSFPGSGEIMELKLEGRNNGAEEDRQLLQAVIDAFLGEVEKAQRARSPMKVIIMQKPVITNQFR
jgi:hypothetical protein